MKLIIWLLSLVITLCICGEDILLKNGSIIKGEIVEVSDEGIKIVFSKSGSIATFSWDELDENYAKKVYFTLFRKQFDTKNYILGVEIKKYSSNKLIKGLYIKEFSTKDAIYVKTRGKLIKLSRKVIEYIKPAGISIFDAYSEKEIYVEVLKNLFRNRKIHHKKVLTELKRHNISVYKLHLLLYLMGKFETIKPFKIYTLFNKLLKNAIDKKDLCVLDYLASKNWHNFTFNHIYNSLIYISTKCNYKNITNSIEQFSDEELMLYSILFSNLSNLYIVSFFNRPVERLNKFIEKEFNEKIKELGILFNRDKADIYKLWNNRTMNFIKVNGCTIAGNASNFYKNWGKINHSTRFLLFVGEFVNRYLKVAGKTLTKKYSNLECFEYVVK